MTDNDFSKALEQCQKNDNCIGCPLEHLDYASECVIEIFKYCSEAIKRKDEQIEALIAGQETLQKYIAEKDAKIKKLKNVVSQDKIEAVKEFANSFKETFFLNGFTWSISLYEFECFLKETVGEG